MHVHTRAYPVVCMCILCVLFLESHDGALRKCDIVRAPVAYYQLKSLIEHTGPMHTSFEGQNVSFWSYELKP